MKGTFLSLILLASSMMAQQPADNKTLTELFNVDQAARQVATVDWTKLRTEDEERRQEVRKMLDSGQVKTALDYFHAALIYQHGQSPEDFLLAHVLAMDAIGLGYKDARWLAAATLDRYLLTISRPQIFGTQFESTSGKTILWQHRSMNSELINDSARSALCVLPLEQQNKILDESNQGKPFRSTNVKNCP